MKHRVIEYESAKGALGIIIDIPDTKVVDIVFSLRAGYAFGLDLKHKIQVPHVLEHILAGYTANHPDQAEFDRIKTINGAYTNASTSMYSMQHIATCPKFEWERILKLQIESIDSPYIVESNLTRELNNVRSELTEKVNNPGYVINRNVSNAMGMPTQTVQGHIDSLDNITLQDVIDVYNHTYRSGNLRFAIAGSFDDQEIAQIKKLLDNIKLPEGGEYFSFPDAGRIHSADPVLVYRSDTPSLTFMWSLIIDHKLDDQQCYDMGVLSDLLCDGMDSRIYGQARQRGLLYWFSCGFSNFGNNGEWSFAGNAGADKIGDVFNLVVDELERVKNGDITDQEIEALKLRQLGSHSMREIKRTHDICNFYSGRYFYEGSIRNYDDIERWIKGVSRERIVETARSIFAKNASCLGLYGNADADLLNRLNDRLQKLATNDV